MSIVSILIAIVIFGILIFSHELGHFLMAKLVGVGVIEFSIGMGPRLISFKKGETRYSLKAIPFGGSCAMVGEDAAGAGEIGLNDEDEEIDPEKSFQNKSVWARILVVIGGPLFNFILAFILGVILTASMGTNDAVVTNISARSKVSETDLSVGDTILEINGHSISLGQEISLVRSAYPIGEEDVRVVFERDGEKHEITYDPSYTVYATGITYQGTSDLATLVSVTEDSPAGRAGLMAGDTITSINGEAIPSGDALAEYISENPFSEEEVVMTISRDGETFDVHIAPELVKGYSLGFSASTYNKDASFFEILGGGFKQVGYGIKAVIYSLKMIFGGQASVKDLSGPVGIVRVIGTTIDATASEGTSMVVLNMVSLSILLSANLGIVNLFPFPALDGGRLVLLIIEAVTKKKLPTKAEGILNLVGFALLMALMLFVMYNDIVKIFQ